MAEYIERKAVLRPFIIDKQGRRINEVDVDNWEVSVSIRSVKNIIREVPAADVVEVKHGKWTIEDLTPGRMRVKCSECKMSRWLERGRFYKYCPNCGARMDG